MRYYKNGNALIAIDKQLDLPEITAEEYSAEMEALAMRGAVQAEIAAATHPLTIDEILRLDMRQRINELSIDNQTAGRMIGCFPTRAEFCAEGALIPAGTRVRDDNDASIIWRSNVDLWNTPENSPENASVLWDRIAYHDGIRVIPEEIPATLAWKKDELGWRGGCIYKSGMDGNVYLPEVENAPWTQLEA